MGIVSSKDETGKYTIAANRMPPGFMDEKCIELRDKMDACLEKHMYYFSIAGLLISVPVSIYFKTERPFFAAAIICPMADMYYGTLKCEADKEAFRLHYRQMERAFYQPLQDRQDRQQRIEQQLANHKWQPREELEGQEDQQKRWWKPW